MDNIKKMIDKEGVKFILIFIVLTFLGVIFFYWGDNGKSLGWEVYNVWGIASTIALSVLAFFGYIKYIKEEDIIKIKFHPKDFTYDNADNDGNIDTGLFLLRKHCTRSEIQGLLGMIFNNYHGNNRYDLQDFLTNKGDILERILNVQNGKADCIVINISKEELKQFNI